MRLKNIFKVENILILLSLTFIAGCTDLDEVVLDEILGETAGNDEGVLAAAYDRLGDKTFTDGSGVWALQQLSTDEALLPERGKDWGDGGKYMAIHEFTWEASNGIIGDTWGWLTNGITRSLTAIEVLNTSEGQNSALFLAEARALLALYTYTTLDLYGRIPYRDPYTEGAEMEILEPGQAIDELILEVEEIIPNLASIGENSTYQGRFTKEAAYGLLSKMYLNRAVYKDRYNASSDFNFLEASVTDANQTDMDKVIYYTSLLIGSGKFALESNFFDNFDLDNGNGTEMIFAVIQTIDNVRNGDNDFVYRATEHNQKTSPETRGTNATCTTPDYYSTWDNNHDDPRFHRHAEYEEPDGTISYFMNDGTDTSLPADKYVVGGTPIETHFRFNFGFQVGQQYGPVIDDTYEGDYKQFKLTDDGRIIIEALTLGRNEGQAMIFNPELHFSDPTRSSLAQEDVGDGVRPFKYQFDPERGNGASGFDIPLFRLGGIYTIRAEAYFRKSETELALADINKLRTSRTREALYDNAPGKAISTLDEESLYREISYELYWEQERRPQMIRFGTFDEAYTAKSKTEAYRRVFPIPQSEMDANDLFTENNPGY